MESEPAPDESRSLPNELMGRTPRRVRLTGTGWLYAGAWAFLFLLGVAGVVKVKQAVDNESARQSTLWQSGSQSLGQVTDMRYTWSSPYVRYSFSVDGTVYFGKAEVPINISDSLHQGDAIPVRYLPADPKVNHPAAWIELKSSTWWLLLFPGWVVPFSFLFVWRFPLQRRLALEGVATWARIAEREWRGPSRGQRWESYTFRNAEGEVEFGTCPMDVALKPGSTVCVLYLPAKPSRSIIYPLDFYEIQ
jgi:hypothetical protein